MMARDTGHARRSFLPPLRERTEGAQSITRAIAIMRVVASSGRRGMSLKQVAARTNLNKSTACRILRVLFEEGMLEHDAATRHYKMGIEVFALTVAMGDRLKAIAQPSLDTLRRHTEDIVYLAVRSGYDGLCLDMVEGDYPEKALRWNVGDRWPLGVGAPNIAMLAALPDAEVAAVIGHNAPRLAGQQEFSPERLRAYVEETRRRGYAVKASTSYPPTRGVAVPILDSHRRPIAAIGVIAVVARMPPERQQGIAELLWQESRVISEHWQAAHHIGAEAEHWALPPARIRTRARRTASRGP